MRTRIPLLGVAFLACGVGIAGCTGSSPAAATRGPANPSSPSSPANAVSGCLAPPASCYSPREAELAYGIEPLLGQGIDGRGETVTVLAPTMPPPGAAVPASSPPPGAGPADIRQDLAAFDSEFRLPAAPVQVVTSLAGAASPAPSYKEIQDVEVVHAAAPAASLRVVLLPASVLDSAASATAGMLAGLRLAVSGTDVAVIGWSLGEHFFTKAQAARLNSLLLSAEAHHVTVVAASGDNGGFSDAPFGGPPVKEVSLPAADPLVLAAGGTTLTLNPATGAYQGETAWNGQAGASISNGASGGGFSHWFARPAYQNGVPRVTSMRGVPDVAGDASQDSGIAIVATSNGETVTSPADGTAAAAALWGGLIALADQAAHHDLGFVNPAIYRIARGSRYHQAFHDITDGGTVQTQPYPAGSAGYQAGPGWDPAAGWGSLDAQSLVPLLAG